MPRENVSMLQFNRGIISPKALARVDVDRTRLSAEVMENWIPATQGSMRIRPGTKYLGSSKNDTGAVWLEFVGSAVDYNKHLIELTNEKLRVWVRSDSTKTWETPVQTGVRVPLARPKVDTTVTLSDTGWSDASTGGRPAEAVTSADIIPKMTAETTNGVRITASSQNSANEGWRIADDANNKWWLDTGDEAGTLPSWVNVDFGSGVTQTVSSYSLRALDAAGATDEMARDWELIAGNYDTGTYATDTGKWTLKDSRTNQTWSAAETKIFTVASPTAHRHYRLYVTAVNESGGTGDLAIAELEMFESASSAPQITFNSGTVTLNATATGSVARTRKRVIVSDTGTEHSLAINVGRGPIHLRVGSTAGDDDYIREAELGTGYHNLGFTPVGDFHVELSTDEQVDRIVQSLTIGDSGTVELTTPWDANALSLVRYDQSADVIYCACDGVRPQKIERRGDSGRSWSVVDYAPNNGPFRGRTASTVKLDLSQPYGNTTLTSDQPFFRETHVGALFRLTHQGQSGTWFLGSANAATDVIEMTGYTDTGNVAQDTGAAPGRERQIRFELSGTYSGRVTVQRSFDGADVGFHDIDTRDTGTATLWVQDNDNNVTVWYRAIFKPGDYTSGAAKVRAFYFNGSRTGICRVTDFNNNQSVDVEVLKRFADTGQTDNWEEGSWSSLRGYPQAVALHEGRLGWFPRGKAQLSVSDDFENFDDTVTGESAPIDRTMVGRSVDQVNFALSMLRLVIGTAGKEISVRSSSIDEPITATNSSAKAFSTLGSAPIRAVPLDNQAIFAHRSGQRVYVIGFGQSAESFGDFDTTELTTLVPELLQAGVVDIAVQRNPDTRVHCVLADGTVALLTYEPAEEVLCWSKWKTDTGTNSAVERAVVLPSSSGEDEVYYHIRRTINGATKRFLEQWASETESMGDTGLSWLVDCAKYQTDTGKTTDIQGFDHLIGQKLVAWSNDTGQTDAGKDLSPDVDGVQTQYTVDTGGNITLTTPQHHVVAGLPYVANFKSTKMAYAAGAGTALGQIKRIDKIAFVLYQAHNNGLYFGDDTGTGLDPMPRTIDGGATVDADRIFREFDKLAMAFKGRLGTDARVYLRAKSPRPMTVMAAIPTVATHDRV